MHPCPRHQSKRGRPPIYPKEYLDFICILMITFNKVLRDMESELKVIKTPWDIESVPDHTTIWRHYCTLDEGRLQEILTRVARACMNVSGWTSGSTGSDGSGVETDKYATITKEGKRRKIYLKYHISAILGLQIVLDAVITPSNVHDMKVLKPMIRTIQSQGIDLAGCTHNCDGAYDWEDNFALLFSINVTPNIRQRKRYFCINAG